MRRDRTGGVLVLLPVVALVLLCAWLPLAPPWLASPPVLVLAAALAVLVAVRAVRSHRASATARDALTGLPGRQELLAAAARALRASSGATGPGVLVVDLDSFRDVNDALGHPVGDEVLRRVAGRLRVLAPAGAVVARLGGDEFAVLVPDGALAEDLARRVVAEAGDHRVGGTGVLVPVSVGVALAPRHGTSAAQLLGSADAALHEAKEVRGRACTYTGERTAGEPGLLLQGDLARAVRCGELFVQYQPQVDPATGVLVGAEALVRWRHPDLGTVAPDRFVPLAERSGLVHELTRVVLEQALGDVADWRACGCDVTVSVNLSARSLDDAGLPALVEAALRRHEVPARALVLEITETGLVSDPQRAGAVVRGLRALGCSVAVDDYGTGHSSLRQLTGLDVDELKIDRSFVTAMTSDRALAVIVRSTVQMARDLGLRVVAEGVEDAGTLRALAALGCHVAQGTHVGEPVAPGDVLWVLAAQRVARTPGVVPRPAAPRHPSGAL
ncbi:putative bifunctional diguanylate cyclase/phosphodiesterase [Kineococcus auxinigenes]|uniref:putative bifunctional diguanylate cyclase/phosphodiesterase n=1 Tax=unclassified Kineococcus TaxID=2621656 RepID=UPI003D7D6375